MATTQRSLLHRIAIRLATPARRAMRRSWRLAWHRVHPPVASTRWLRAAPPLAGRKVCVLASYAADGRFSELAVHLCRAWRTAGFAVIAILAVDDIDEAVPSLDDAEGLLLRENVGYDFGSWADAMAGLPDLPDASLVALANDSVFGPLDNFAAMLDRVDSSTADIVAATESQESRRHLQSYLIFYKRAALASQACRAFWQGPFHGDREETIARAELRQLAMFEGAGLKVDILFPVAGPFAGNPTLQRWRELIARGFPFVKVQLLRDNPFDVDVYGWDDLMCSRGYEPSAVHRHFGTAFATTAAYGTRLAH